MQYVYTIMYYSLKNSVGIAKETIRLPAVLEIFLAKNSLEDPKRLNNVSFLAWTRW